MLIVFPNSVRSNLFKENLGKASSHVVDSKLENSILVRSSELSKVGRTIFIYSLHIESPVRIDSNEFNLDIVSHIGYPFPIFQLFNVNLEMKRVAFLVVMHVLAFLDQDGVVESVLQV